MIECLLVETPEQFAHCAAIRMEVFVREQQVPADEEMDDLDAVSVHVLARADGVPVGTGRLIPLPEGKAKIGRMAVLRDHRGSGVGSAVMERLLEVARQRDVHRVSLAAQLHAIGFYERFGFEAHGPVFLDAGIEHRDMERALE
jgi:predicted GNAT family N-acyltransferase